MSIARVLQPLIANLQHLGLRGAEVGVYRGDTAHALLKEFPDLFLYMVDTWSAPDPSSKYFNSGDSAAQQHWADHLANEQVAYDRTAFAADRRILLRGSSVVAAQALQDRTLTFAFIDADHTYEGVSADIRAWWPKIQPGGMLAGHDFGSRPNRTGRWGVDKAVREFVESTKTELNVAARRIWWVAKPQFARAASS